jgi:hypothetical protein
MLLSLKENNLTFKQSIRLIRDYLNETILISLLFK